MGKSLQKSMSLKLKCLYDFWVATVVKKSPQKSPNEAGKLLKIQEQGISIFRLSKMLMKRKELLENSGFPIFLAPFGKGHPKGGPRTKAFQIDDPFLQVRGSYLLDAQKPRTCKGGPRHRSFKIASHKSQIQNARNRQSSIENRQFPDDPMARFRI